MKFCRTSSKAFSVIFQLFNQCMRIALTAKELSKSISNS